MDLCWAKIPAAEVRQRSEQKYLSELLVWKKSKEISELNNKRRSGALTAKEAERLRNLRTINRDVLEHFFSLVVASTRFRRGEIEQPTVADQVIQGVELSLLAGNLPEFAYWFKFAADLAYEEASRSGLHLASRIRTLLMAETEILLRRDQSSEAIRQILVTLEESRFPWPIDRVITLEAPRHFQGRELVFVQSAAKKLAGNPYRSAVSIVGFGKKGSPQAWLSGMWTEDDVEALKSELFQRGSLICRAAILLFRKKDSRTLNSLQELVSAGILRAVPINYRTGNPFSLADLENRK